MYQKMYTTLFNAVTDALNMMEDQDYAAARLRLMAAQRKRRSSTSRRKKNPRWRKKNPRWRFALDKSHGGGIIGYREMPPVSGQFCLGILNSSKKPSLCRVAVSFSPLDKPSSR